VVVVVAYVHGTAWPALLPLGHNELISMCVPPFHDTGSCTRHQAPACTALTCKIHIGPHHVPAPVPNTHAHTAYVSPSM
jgi:hypothetical protein